MFPDTPIVFQFRPISCSNTLFLDRDGVLNEVVLRGEKVSSPQCVGEFSITDDIAALADSDFVNNWNLIVVSNQPDLSRGLIGLELIEEINRLILARIPLNSAYICPHLQTENCLCRKPKTGLIQQFYKDNPMHKGKELLVGDRLVDLECAANAGIDSALIRREYNSEVTSANFHIDNLWSLVQTLKNL